MGRLLKFHKNSFIFLETIFALIILSFVISSFFKLTHQQNENNILLNSVNKILQLKTSSSFLSTSTQTLTFETNSSKTYKVDVHQITYNDGTIRLIQYEK